jgi:hypothetical protein
MNEKKKQKKIGTVRIHNANESAVTGEGIGNHPSSSVFVNDYLIFSSLLTTNITIIIIIIHLLPLLLLFFPT